MDFEITDIVTDIDRQTVRDGLIEYNISKFEDINPKDLGIYYKVDSKMKAGIVGETHGNWLEVDFLWVSEELRRKGVGSSLLKAAEEEAVKRGCRYCFLNTYGFQAPLFYKKYGYREVFTLENIPRTGTRHYFVKEF